MTIVHISFDLFYFSCDEDFFSITLTMDCIDIHCFPSNILGVFLFFAKLNDLKSFILWRQHEECWGRRRVGGKGGQTSKYLIKVFIYIIMYMLFPSLTRCTFSNRGRCSDEEPRSRYQRGVRYPSCDVSDRGVHLYRGTGCHLLRVLL